jgi:hypothetical protein
MAIANAVSGMAGPVGAEAERISSELFHLVADVSMKDSCTDGHFIKVLHLLRRGADPNHVENGQSVLIAGANQRLGYYDCSIAQLLIEYGADPHFLYQEKTAPQWIAWRAGHGAEELETFIANFTHTARSARLIERTRIR